MLKKKNRPKMNTWMLVWEIRQQRMWNKSERTDIKYIKWFIKLNFSNHLLSLLILCYVKQYTKQFIQDLTDDSGKKKRHRDIRAFWVIRWKCVTNVFRFKGINIEEAFLNNHGYARKIYEAFDVVLQLRNFYKEISSPMLSNVTFNYMDTQVNIYIHIIRVPTEELFYYYNVYGKLLFDYR